jgi:modulator of FtsH protease
MGLVAVTCGTFALGAYVGRNTTGLWMLLWYIAAFAMLFGLNVAVRRSDRSATTSTPTRKVVWQAGGATALFIAGFGAGGYAIRRDLSALARLCFWALLALIVFGIVLIFVHISHGELIYAVLGLVIFAGLVMFDFQRLRTARDIRAAPLLAASIFLDVLNVFLLFLQIFGNRD